MASHYSFNLHFSYYSEIESLLKDQFIFHFLMKYLFIYVVSFSFSLLTFYCLRDVFIKEIFSCKYFSSIFHF